MTFVQRRNRLTTHFSERSPVVKRRLSVLVLFSLVSHNFLLGKLSHSVAFPRLYAACLPYPFVACTVSRQAANGKSIFCCINVFEQSTFQLNLTWSEIRSRMPCHCVCMHCDDTEISQSSGALAMTSCGVYLTSSVPHL